jgi:hypothetical protein
MGKFLAMLILQVRDSIGLSLQSLLAHALDTDQEPVRLTTRFHLPESQGKTHRRKN